MSKKLISLIIIVFMLLPLFEETSIEAKELDSSRTSVETITSQALIHDETPHNHKLTYKVYLPKGYDKKRKKGYPVVYLLHGSYGDENSWDDFWNKLDSMIENNVIEPMIAVAPATGNSYWVDSKKFGNFESAVIKDLIPRIDQKFNTISDRNGRYLSGYSMGGYGALRYSMVYPNLFSGATLLSPAIQNQEAPVTSGAVERGSFGEPFDPEVWTAKNYPTAIESYIKQPNRVPIYIVTGDDDWNHLSEKDDLPIDAYKYNMEVQAVQLYQELHRKNLFNLDFPKWEEVPANPAELRIINGGHGLDVWLQGFEEGLKYMFGKQESEELAPIYDAGRYTAKRKGNITTKTYLAPSLVKDSTMGKDELGYNIYLPHGYDSEHNTEYPVVYLLHGSGGNVNSWNRFWPILDKMIELKKISPVIAVAPITGNSYWVDSEKFGAIESAVIQDLIPKIDEDFKTISSRDGRGIVGFSMGGYGALRYSLAYPQLFGGSTLLSPAIQHDEAPATSGAVDRGSFGDPFDPTIWDKLNYPATLKTYGNQSYEVPTFIITGDDDWNHISEKEDLPTDAYKYNMEVQAVKLYQHLHRSNVFNRSFDKWEDVPGSPAELRILNGGHDMSVWATGFEQGLTYMFEKGLSVSR
jgi:enterochelin esterase-like enzyme